jgi:hypothetical protein
MGNFDLVMPYDSRMESWLGENGYPHPKAKPDNRYPTKQEIFDAIWHDADGQKDPWAYFYKNMRYPLA